MLGFTGITLTAQDATKRYGIYMEYLKSYTSHIDDGISSNIVKINNNTDKTRQFVLNTQTPSGWRALGRRERIITIAARDSAFVPVRVIPQLEIKGGDIIRLKTSLYSDDMLISTAQWIIETEMIHQWTAKIMKDDTHFFHDSDSTNVQVYFNNEGNVDEELTLQYYPSRLLELVKAADSEKFTLKVGRDTTINIEVRIKPEMASPSKLYEKPKRSLSKYSLKVKAQSPGRANSAWQRSATFTKAATVYKENKMKWDHLPLTIDFQSYDILGENPYASLGLYGIKHFDADRYLRYNFQFLGATGDHPTLESNYQHIAYYSPHLQVQLGDISNTHVGGISMQGKGAMIRTVFGKRHSLSGIYTRHARLLEENKIRNYGFDYAFKTLNNRFDTKVYVQRQSNVLQMYDKELLGLRFRIVPIKNQQFSLQADVSQTQFGYPTITDSIEGYNLIGAYNGRFFRRLDLGFNYQLSSPDFVSYAGAENIKGYLNLRVKDNQSIMSHYINRTYSPNVYSNGNLIYSGMRSAQEEAKLSYRYRKNSQSLSLYGQYNAYDIPNYELDWYGGGIDYANTLSLYSRINTSVSIWRNTFNAIEDDYTTIHFRLAFRQRNFRMSGLYYYGARYMIDHINYAESRETPRSYFVNANYEYWGGKQKKVLLNLASNVSYRTTLDRLQVNFRPNVEYYVAQGFKIKGYASVVAFNQGERDFEINNKHVINPQYSSGRFEMGLGFTKDIGLPMSSKNNFDLKFIAFCDDNGNGVKDANEECIPNMLIVATELTETNNVDFSSYSGNLEVITNENGEAVILNIDKGNYRIETHPLQRLKSWYTDRNFSTAVFEDKTIYLAQAKGGKIYGSIQLEVGNHSRFDNEISLENIKITAADSSGFVYSCLTDKNGSFILNAPMGAYTISVNEELFSGSFVLAENNMLVVIDNVFSEKQQNFFVKEKERKVVITKFAADEEKKKEEKEEDQK